MFTQTRVKPPAGGFRLSAGVFLALGALVGTGSGCAADPPDGHATAPDTAVGIFATGCPTATERGSGTMIGGDLVTTAAHVVAGATHIDVRFGGGHHAATIAAIDTRSDLAVLRVEGLERESVELRSATASETGAYVGYGGPEPVLKSFSIKRRIVLTSQDIYGNGNYPRAAYDVAASVATGDSGGGLFVDGALIGVMWARSRQTEQQAYAIDISEFRQLIDGVEGHTLPSTTDRVPCR